MYTCEMCTKFSPVYFRYFSDDKFVAQQSQKCSYKLTSAFSFHLNFHYCCVTWELAFDNAIFFFNQKQNFLVGGIAILVAIGTEQIMASKSQLL